MNIGIIAATSWEIRGFINALNLKKNGERSFGNVGSKTHLSVEISGIGQENARKACERILTSFKEPGSSLVISAGFACALKDGISAGDLVMDGMKSDPVYSKKLMAAAQIRGVNAHSGGIWTSDRLLENKSDKDKILGETGALAAEMESRAVFNLCKERSIPFLSFRTISDVLDQDLPRSASYLDSSGKTGIRFWRRILLNSGDWYGMVRLSLSSRRAERSLTKVLLNFIKEIAHDD